MGQSTNNSMVRGRVARGTRVDGCGAPIFGDDSVVTTKNFVTVAYTGNTLDSDEINLTDADGEPSVYEAAQTRFASENVEVTFSKVDPEFFELFTKQRVLRDIDGVAVGFAINKDVDVYIEGFALEVWAGTGSGSVCDAQGRPLFGYNLTPFAKGARLGDYTIENGAITFTITGAVTYSGNQWGKGPHNVVLNVGDVPGPLLEDLLPGDHKVLLWTPVPPPTPFVGARPLLDPASTPITAIVDAEGSSPTETELTFTGASAAPVWVEWGDGTWSYVEDGTDGAVHAYDANGPYTVRASSNGTWITDTVVIPYP